MIKVDLGLTLDQLRAITDEAPKAGVPVVGHSQNIRKAVEIGGLKYMEHTDTLGRAILEEMGPDLKKGAANPERLMDTNRFEPLIQIMVRERVYLNPTIVGRWRTSTPRGQEWANATKDMTGSRPGVCARDCACVLDALPGREADNEGYRKAAEFLGK